MRIKQLGTFKVESGKVTISDPCYSKGTWCAGEVPAVNGSWKAEAELNGEGRVMVLTAGLSTAKGKWEQTKIDGGVDSGQMSIFDSKFYLDDSEAKGAKPGWMEPSEGEEGYSPFYSACCNLTCDENSKDLHGGVLPHGVVASSGYGDGSYPVFVKKNAKGLAVAIKVEF